MIKMLSVSALLLALASPGLSAQTPSAAQPAATPPAAAAPAKATPQNAAAFVGDWDLAGEGSNGPASFGLSVAPQGEALTVVLTNSDGAPQAVDDVAMVGATLSLSVTFTNAGNQYPAVVSLTPSADKVLLHIEVAGGLAQLDGTATKKVKK